MEVPKERDRQTLSDIINYEPEVYLTSGDMDLIRSTFKDNPRLLHVLRKVFLPSVGDQAMPLEEIGQDVWMNMDFSLMQNEEIKSIVLARQDAIKFVAGSLIRLKIIANSAIKSPLEEEIRKQKDSSK